MRKFISIIETVVIVGLIILLAFTTFKITTADKTEGQFILGYRPVYIVSGSMEPTLKTKGVIITKEVSGVNDISSGDIVTYKFVSPESEVVRITHRVVSISEDGIIKTKGDNNKVIDAYDLRIENIEAKEVLTINQTAILINFLSTSFGKILTACGILSFIILSLLVKQVRGYISERKSPEEETVI